MGGPSMATEMRPRCLVCGGSALSQLFMREDGRSVRLCQTCGLGQVVPRPTAREVARLYREDSDHFRPYLEQIEVHRSYFRRKIQDIFSLLVARRDENFLGTAIRLHPAKILSHLAPFINSPPTLLDIGCAMGVLLEEAQKQGIEAYGVDVSADAAAYCRKKGLRVSQTIPRARFDVVTLFEVIEHEANPIALMRRVYKLLKNGGIALITTPNHDTFWRKLMGKWWVGYRHPEHLNFFNETSLKELMKRAGFTKIVLRKDTPRPFPLSFLFTRGADYFPWAAWFLKPIGNMLKHTSIVNPINPWGDLLALVRK